MVEGPVDVAVRPVLQEPRKPPDGPRHQVTLTPSRERLDKPSSFVSFTNTSQQTHILIDRHLRGVEFRPGQTREIEMLNDEINALIALGRKGRGFYESGYNAGKELPPHPLQLAGASDLPSVQERPLTFDEAMRAHRAGGTVEEPPAGEPLKTE